MAVADVVSGAGGNPTLRMPPSAPEIKTERVEISATVLSTDLFTPYQDPRVTLPTIGERQQVLQPLGGRLWAGSITEYGGIGGLPHLGIQQVKDLPVSRSHRHYQSGLTKHEGGPQPYRLTELKLSDCRVNDQRDPPPMRTDPTKLEWKRHNPSSWPDFHAYTSHRPRCQVFPAGDTAQPRSSAAQSTPATKLTKPVCAATRNAISHLNRRLYQRTSYQDSFSGYTVELLQSAAATASLSSRLTTLGVMPIYGSDNGDYMYLPVFSEADGTELTITEQQVKSKSNTCHKDADDNEEDDSDQEDTEDDADAEITVVPPQTPTPRASQPATASDTSNRTQTSPSSKKSVSFNETPQIMEGTIKTFTITPNKLMTGVGPCWPPSTSHVIDSINGSQLLERNDITQFPPAYRSALKQSPVTAAEDKQNNFIRQKRPPTPSKAHKSTTAPALREDACHTPSPTGIPPAPALNPALICHNIAVKRSAPLQPLSASQKVLVMLSHCDDYEADPYRELNLPPTDGGKNQQPFVVPSGYWNMKRKSAPPTLPALTKSKSKVFNWSAPQSRAQSGHRSLALPPAPLSDCLTPSGRRVPHRLGLRYKTEAHKRYHTVYPDSVPDLRNSGHNYGGKRYFFFGNLHSSDFRG